jgi:hypothetical protein
MKKVLKKSKYHIVFARLLLLIFIAGQAIVYGHQHTDTFASVNGRHHATQQTVSERCQLCDAMHYNTMELAQAVYFQPVLVSRHLFTIKTYHFLSLSLILASGRAPPLS